MSLRNRPSRRATAEEPELSLPHWHLCDTLQPALGARMTGRCAWRYEQRGATRPHSQLLRRTSQLTTVRAAAPSSTTLPPPTPLPSGSRLLVARAPARASLRLTRFPGWAGGLMARRGAVRWAVGRLFERCTSRVSRGSLDTVVSAAECAARVPCGAPAHYGEGRAHQAIWDSSRLLILHDPIYTRGHFPLINTPAHTHRESPRGGGDSQQWDRNIYGRDFPCISPPKSSP